MAKRTANEHNYTQNSTIEWIVILCFMFNAILLTLYFIEFRMILNSVFMAIPSSTRARLWYGESYSDTAIIYLRKKKYRIWSKINAK